MEIFKLFFFWKVSVINQEGTFLFTEVIEALWVSNGQPWKNSWLYMKATASAQLSHPLVASDWKSWYFICTVNTSYLWCAEMPVGRRLWWDWCCCKRPVRYHPASQTPSSLRNVEQNQMCLSPPFQPSTAAPPQISLTGVFKGLWEFYFKFFCFSYNFLKILFLCWWKNLPMLHSDDSRLLVCWSHCGVTAVLNVLLVFFEVLLNKL